MLSYKHEVMHMQNSRMKECPACGERLHIGRLICPGCRAEFPTDTPLSAYDYLTADESAFLTAFLTCRGNLKEVQASLGISYPSAKKKLDGVLESLGLKEKETFINIKENPNMFHFSEARTGSTRASDIVKNKLLACGGSARVTSLRGVSYTIHALQDSVACQKWQEPIKYSVFDVIVDFLLEQGGSAKKGSAQQDRVGYGMCADDTIACAIGKRYFGRRDGESAPNPISQLLAILEWSGIVKNLHGNVELTADYLAKVRG